MNRGPDIRCKIPPQVTRAALAAYLERVVTECADAEFSAYAALPEKRLDEVRRWFCTDGPALREITNRVTRHQQPPLDCASGARGARPSVGSAAG